MRWKLPIAAVLAAAVAGLALRDDVHGLTLVLRAADLHGAARRLADRDVTPVHEWLTTVPLAAGVFRMRVFEPATPARHAVLLVSGLNPAGLDEPRLHRLARTLAEARVTVLTPELPELSRYEISDRITDQIEQAAVWLARDSRLSEDGRIGIMGISFSGGLSIVAASRPSLRGRLRYVLSFGGHDDLGRVLAFLCSGSTEGCCDEATLAARPPHDYGVAIVMLTVAARLVPEAQVTPLRAAVGRYLWASYLERDDAAGAERERRLLRQEAATLPEPSATLLRYLDERDVRNLGPILSPHVNAYVSDRALSPSLSPVPDVPLFLLHGRDDTVIPSSESERLAARARGHTEVHLLLTDVISHAEADRPARVTDVLRLAHFWGAMLAR